MHPVKKIGLFSAIAAALSAPYATLAEFNGDTGLPATGEQAGLNTASDQLPIVIGAVIKTVLGVVGIVFLVLMVYAGFIWMIARGDEGKVEKAKNTIINCIIGVVIVVGAYAITSFIIDRLNPSPTDAAATAPVPAEQN
jgi:apolipoprotein N-acyltransferase